MPRRVTTTVRLDESQVTTLLEWAQHLECYALAPTGSLIPTFERALARLRNRKQK